MGLFEKWYALELKSGLTQAEALRQLNAACGTKYKSNWIAQQQQSVQGLTRTPLQVRRYLMERVLRDILAKHGITDGRVIRHFLNDLI